MDFGHAFVLWHAPTVNYEGGVLSNTARVAIHFTHRLGALVAAAALALAAIGVLREGSLARGPHGGHRRRGGTGPAADDRHQHGGEGLPAVAGHRAQRRRGAAAAGTLALNHRLDRCRRAQLVEQ